MVTLFASLLVLHLDFNTVQMKAEAVVDALRVAAKAGYNAVLWEVEDKVRWETCSECADPEAFTKDEFRVLLAEADRLGLEPIPLFQTFGHGEYVLKHAKYAGWREKRDFAGCYCVSNPEVVAFQKAMLREYVELFGPKVRRIHLGGDEALAFGTCPTCRRQEKMALYAQHLLAVSEDLRRRGIKPGIWADMILMGGDWKRNGEIAGETLGKLPARDFTLWHWDYGYGAESRGSPDPCLVKTSLLKKVGYEIILSGSTHSWQDGPFLPRFRRHRDNLAACAALVRSEGLAGLCVTSWSVHLSPKSLQYPLWEFAAKRLRAPGEDSDTEFDAIVAERWGAIPFSVLDDLTVWSIAFDPFDVRMRNYLKSGAPAEAGYLAGVLNRLSAEKARRAALLGDVSKARPRIAAARNALPAVAPRELAAGSALACAFLDAVRATVSAEAPTTLPCAETRRYYACWQPPKSAERACALVWSALEQNPRAIASRPASDGAGGNGR